MAITVDTIHCSYRRNIYQVNFFDHSIKTTLTANPYEVVSWIERIEYTHYRRLHNLIVGLDVEWRPKFVKNIPEYPVAILQLCVGHHCLIFQIQHCKEIPQALTDFLSNENYSFVGVGIDEDVRKLSRDYNLNVFKTVDLRSAASKRWNDKEYMKKGLTALAKEAMEIEYKKSKRITLSNWSKRNLTNNQISYAAIDAFLSFEIGRSLKVQELS